MDTDSLFLACLPGFEPALRDELGALGFGASTVRPGGVELPGDLGVAAQLNLRCRIADRVLLRIASFRALHLAQLDKRARKLDWAAWLRPDVPVRVEASCARSRIYHEGAAAQRVARAIADATGAATKGGADPLRVLLRIEDDLATLSLDTSGVGLHKRGHKPFVAKAPLRETMAAAFLHQMGFDGTQPVLDPMCGAGTFVLEAAEIAAGLAPGRAREFAHARLACPPPAPRAPAAAPPPLEPCFFGYDRDQGAVQGAQANAARAGLEGWTRFACQPIGALTTPDGPRGLVMVNPPYGGRIGNARQLYPLYASLGAVLRAGFAGWRLGLVTAEPALARATGLALTPGPPVPHGGRTVRLYQSKLL